MRQIDYNLPHTHPHNVEAAEALGRKWSDEYRMYINRDGTIPSGYEGDKDSRWPKPLTYAQAVHAHK